MKALLGFVFAVLLQGCEKNEPISQVPSTPTPPQLSNELKGSWPITSSAKVTGYRFRADSVEEFTNLVHDQNRIDLGELAKRTEASAELQQTDVAELLEATFQKEEGLSAAACYDPHHLFVFQNEAGEITHAIEICFGCTNLSTLPSLEENQWQRHDFRRLYKLCEALGLAEGSSDEYFKVWDQREAP